MATYCKRAGNEPAPEPCKCWLHWRTTRREVNESILRHGHDRWGYYCAGLHFMKAKFQQVIYQLWPDAVRPNTSVQWHAERAVVERTLGGIVLFYIFGCCRHLISPSLLSYYIYLTKRDSNRVNIRIILIIFYEFMTKDWRNNAILGHS
ncbi:MAG: hypothetical protein WCS21_11255 [Lachnospiraceae bacterium]